MRRTFGTGVTMGEKRVRIRLKFQDLDILSSQQVELGLAQCWYMACLGDSRIVADISADIQTAFHLKASGPCGINLEVDGFVLPASQPADILQDSDLVRVTRRNDKYVPPQRRLLREAENGHFTGKECLPNFSLWPPRYRGTELRAVEEFEKETGGYEDDEEGGEMDTDHSADGTILRLEDAEACLERKSCHGKKSKKFETLIHKPIEHDQEDESKRRVGRIYEEFEAGKALSLDGKSSQPKSEVASLGGERKTSQSTKEREKGKKIREGAAQQGLDEFTARPVEAKHEETKAVTIPSWDKKESWTKLKPASFGAERKQVLSGEKSKKTKKEKSERALEANDKATDSDTVPISDGRKSQLLLAMTSCDTEDREADNPKKRKKAKAQKSDGQDQVFQNKERKLPRVDGAFGVNETEKDGQQKVKRQKNKSSAGHCVPTDVKSVTEMMDAKVVEAAAADCTEELTKPFKKKRKADASPGKVNEARAGAVKVVGDEKLGSPPKNARTAESDAIIRINPVQPPKDDSKEIKIDVEHVPSRSARRKKAKRRWLREQAKLAGVDGHQLSKVNGSTVLTFEGKPKSLDIEDAMEMEAEEEMLPVIVHAGHIRFESATKVSNGETLAQSSKLGEPLTSKSQQRSSVVGNGKTRSTAASFLPSLGDLFDKHRDTDGLSFATFPSLEGVPQEGDVLAYRLLELTASWTPEISPFRVGVVCLWDHVANVIKLDRSYEYLEWQHDRDLQYDEEEEVVAPYAENGSLEIELSSLIDIRLVRRDPTKTRDIVAHPELDEAASVSNLQKDVEGSEPATNARSSCAVKNQEVDSGDAIQGGPDWQSALLENLQRKRIELSQKDSPHTATLQATAPTPEIASSQQEDSKTANIEIDAGMPVREPSISKGKKYKILKSSGVGTIISLLRAQHAI